MNKETLIKKWLDHDLSPEEQKAFEALDDSKDLVALSNTLKGFEAPNYDLTSELNVLNSKLKAKPKTNWIRPLLKIAAILAIGFSVFYVTTNLDTNVSTELAAKTITTLPDASTVNLNAESTLTYNKNNWSKTREVHLNGEGFFKVAKGSKFEVITDAGKVAVLGTEFNVKHRENYFEVTCYEGLVAVTHNNKTVKLSPGLRFAIVDGKIITNEKETQLLPSWMAQESHFESRPLKFVLNELERQYGVRVTVENVNDEAMFSGSFTHDDLELALKSITLPLQLDFKITNSEIIITGE
ncbi:FecR family protein [Winogradskyella sp. A3E31]|uniref:FecR family protein n=1 Tax=Winogradskyella sp. A3E31 TaxID=3349637 RepID=UPI00398A910D